MDDRGPGIGRSLAYGALAGLLVILAAGAYLYFRVANEPRSAGSDDVLVLLVLPDEEGVVLPRAIDRVRDGDAESVDPLTTATVPGTSFTELREAYPFSGADGLAAALVEGTDAPRPSFVLLDANAWTSLAGSDMIQIDIPEHMDVFDGERLYTFREGEQEIAPDEVAALFNGADYLDAAPRARIREQVGAYVRDLLARNGAGDAETDLTAEELAAWLGSLS